MKSLFRFFILGLILSASGVNVFSQISINTDNSQPDPSAGLDVKFSNKGFLLPRMNHAQLNDISNPANGLMVYCTDCGLNGLGSLSVFMDGDWRLININCLNPPFSPIAGTHVPSGNQITWNWNAVSYATGYKWNTMNDYTSAIDMSTSTTKTETGLSPNTTYTRFVWAYNNCGASAVTAISQTLPFILGQSFGGGILFYIDGTGQNGLIAAPSDQSPGAEWGCNGTVISGTSTNIGTGQASTTAIVNGCSTPGIAARICDDLVLNGFDDWFLPSKDELNQMYLQKNVIGGFNLDPLSNSAMYWSSSQYSPNPAGYAWQQSFVDGNQHLGDPKYLNRSVRAIRAFPFLPTLTTTAVSSITPTTAVSGGNVTMDGGAPVTARGVCWSTSVNPTTANSHTTDGSGTGAFISNLTGLTQGNFYYVRAYATNSVGTSYGNQISFWTFYIGQNFGGGIIFYIDGTGQHGLISPTSDQSAHGEWGCYGTLIGGTSLAIGMGQANTTTILNGCSQAGIAARICDDLVLNGYSDWFLPSKDEIYQMYLHKTAIGGFANDYYWSSSEYNANYAWGQNFTNGDQNYSNKDYPYTTYYVRAVRAF
jgi:hypothetical protein